MKQIKEVLMKKEKHKKKIENLQMKTMTFVQKITEWAK